MNVIMIMLGAGIASRQTEGKKLNTPAWDVKSKICVAPNCPNSAIIQYQNHGWLCGYHTKYGHIRRAR